MGRACKTASAGFGPGLKFFKAWAGGSGHHFKSVQAESWSVIQPQDENLTNIAVLLVLCYPKQSKNLQKYGMTNPEEVDGLPAKRARVPSTHLTDSLNDADLELMSHCQARSHANSCQTALSTSTLTSTTTTTTLKHKHDLAHPTAAATASNAAIPVTSEKTNSVPQGKYWYH